MYDIPRYKNAFNSIRSNDLYEIMDKYRVPVGLKMLIVDYLNNRKIKVTDSDFLDFNVGVPQGSCLGPTLWLLVINELLLKTRNKSYEMFCYADDIVILISESASYIFTDSSKDPLFEVKNWCDRFSLTLSMQKCIFTLFKYGKRITHILRIKLNNINLKYSNTLKYLGIIFDNNRTFIPHLNELKFRVDSISYKIRSIARATWGLSSLVVKKLYLLVIEKIILYGCNIWFRPTAKILQKLPQLQRASLIQMTKCYRTVSSDALNVLAGCLPLDLSILKEIDYINYIKNLEIDMSGINLNLSNNAYYNNAICVHFNIKHDKNLGSFTEIYTDGSKVNERVGAGVVIYKDQVEVDSFSYRLNNNATVFMAELYAIYRAIAFVIKDYYNSNVISNKYVIISDSMSALIALSSSNEYRTYILNLKNKIKFFNIDLFLTRAHVGVLGNERADEMAKLGTNKAITDVIFLPTKVQVRNILLDIYIETLGIKDGMIA